MTATHSLQQDYFVFDGVNPRTGEVEARRCYIYRLHEGDREVSVERFRGVMEEPRCTDEGLGWVNFPTRGGNQPYVVWVDDKGELKKTRVTKEEVIDRLPQIYLRGENTDPAIHVAFAFTCRSAVVRYGPSGDLEIQAEGITSTFYVPARRDLQIHFVARAEGGIGDVPMTDLELRVIGPKGEELAHPRYIIGDIGTSPEQLMGLFEDRLNDQWVVHADLSDADFRSPGTHRMVFRVAGKEVASVPFEVAVLSKD